MTVSGKGLSFLANLEMPAGVAKGWGLGEFDTKGTMTGLYPHYVFVNKGTDTNPRWVSDGGITLGHGIWVSKALYNSDPALRALVDKYAPGASFTPPYTPSNGVPYKVPGSSYMPIAESVALYEKTAKEHAAPVADFLKKHNIKLQPHQFDALVSIPYQYGASFWEPHKDGKLNTLPQLIIDGNGVYDSERIRQAFEIYVDKDRRRKEVELFINGY